jgi:hypothetical protein
MPDLTLSFHFSFAFRFGEKNAGATLIPREEWTTIR